MNLLTKELLAKIPPLGATAKDADPLIVCKFFYPDFGWTWYVIEFDGNDVFYGVVDGYGKELGSFSLTELLQNHGKLGCAIERDLYFEPCRVSELMKS